VLFSGGCIISALTNYHSAAKEAACQEEAREEKQRMKKETADGERGWESAEKRGGKLAFFHFFPFFGLLSSFFLYPVFIINGAAPELQGARDSGEEEEERFIKWPTKGKGR